MPESPAAVLSESAIWSDTINRIEPREHLKGGIDGNLNHAPRELANRTRYLKAVIDALPSELAALAAAIAAQASFQFTQAVAAPVWYVNHGLNRAACDVNIVVDGDKASADVHYVDNNNLMIIFSVPVAGIAQIR